MFNFWTAVISYYSYYIEETKNDIWIHTVPKLNFISLFGIIMCKV